MGVMCRWEPVVCYLSLSSVPFFFFFLASAPIKAASLCWAQWSRTRLRFRLWGGCRWQQKHLAWCAGTEKWPNTSCSGNYISQDANFRKRIELTGATNCGWNPDIPFGGEKAGPMLKEQNTTTKMKQKSISRSLFFFPDKNIVIFVAVFWKNSWWILWSWIIYVWTKLWGGESWLTNPPSSHLWDGLWAWLRTCGSSL